VFSFTLHLFDTPHRTIATINILFVEKCSVFIKFTFFNLAFTARFVSFVFYAFCHFVLI